MDQNRPPQFKPTEYQPKDNIMFWLAGSLIVALVLVAFSIWGPVRMSPEDINPAAGSSTFVDEDLIINNTNTDQRPAE